MMAWISNSWCPVLHLNFFARCVGLASAVDRKDAKLPILPLVRFVLEVARHAARDVVSLLGPNDVTQLGRRVVVSAFSEPNRVAAFVRRAFV
jgi:hypothetical protein